MVRCPKPKTVHTGNAEAVKSAKLTDIEIYQVTEDIGEAKNLAAEQPERLAELTQTLQTAYADLISGYHVWGIPDEQLKGRL